MGNAVVIDGDGSVVVHNDTDVATSDVFSALLDQQPVVAALVRWTGDTRPPARQGNLFERDRFVTPEKVFNQIRLAQQAAESDDVVSGVLDTTESLAFSSMSFFCDDLDEEDVWNQVAGDIDLDSRMREMWRELFIASQFTAAVWWGTKTYKVRGTTPDGNARRKTYANLKVPLGITLLDPVKVVPVGNTMFNQEQLAYVATRSEGESFDGVLANRGSDAIVERLITTRYTPSLAEERVLHEDGVEDTKHLFLLNPQTVFRHTATRPQYRRFADVRMRSIFELLDLKQQLRGMDRAHLIGGTNFIILVKKGSDELPAKPEEIANLQAQVRTVARVPVIVGDHRLNVEIITPKTDNTMRPERYNTIDARLTARLFQMFLLGNYHAGGASDDSVKLARVVAAGMESRRHMLRRYLEKMVLRPAMAFNPELTSAPKLRFHPKRIALDFDQAFASFLLDLRDTGDLSRETILSQFDFDQEDEALYRTREAEHYDDIFQTQVPGAPARATPAAKPKATTPAAQKRAGRSQGGTKSGGGAAPGAGQGQAPRRPRKSDTAKAEEEGDDGED